MDTNFVLVSKKKFHNPRVWISESPCTNDACIEGTEEARRLAQFKTRDDDQRRTENGNNLRMVNEIRFIMGTVRSVFYGHRGCSTIDNLNPLFVSKFYSTVGLPSSKRIQSNQAQLLWKHIFSLASSGDGSTLENLVRSSHNLRRSRSNSTRPSLIRKVSKKSRDTVTRRDEKQEQNERSPSERDRKEDEKRKERRGGRGREREVGR